MTLLNWGAKAELMAHGLRQKRGQGRPCQRQSDQGPQWTQKVDPGGGGARNQESRGAARVTPDQGSTRGTKEPGGAMA